MQAFTKGWLQSGPRERPKHIQAVSTLIARQLCLLAPSCEPKPSCIMPKASVHTVTILVEKSKGLLELGNLLVTQVLSHGCCSACYTLPKIKL